MDDTNGVDLSEICLKYCYTDCNESHPALHKYKLARLVFNEPYNEESMGTI